LRTQATTGLTGEQFDELVARIEDRVRWDCGRGRPKGLTLRQAVKATIMYFRTNVTEEVIGELLFVDQATISRAIGELEGVIADVLDEFVPDLAVAMDGRVGVVDGSLCPCWSWADSPELYSGKHKTTGHSHQFVCDLSGDLMHVSDPLPGKTHDAKAVNEIGLSEILRDDNSIGDKGFIGTGPTTPFRKPPGGELLDWQKEFNTTINKIRYVIERAIANFKTWRCMFTDYRRPLRTYPTAFRAVRALHFFKLRFA
jgi:DDE superfamily endonuclease